MTGRTIGNLVLMALICVVVFMALRPARADWYPDTVSGWSLDWRRCIARNREGNGRFEATGFWDIGFSSSGEKNIIFVRIDRVDFLMSPPVSDFDDHHPVAKELFLRALARGKRLQVFVDDKTEPVDEVQIGDGRGLVRFLRECGSVSTPVRDVLPYKFIGDWCRTVDDDSRYQTYARSDGTCRFVARLERFEGLGCHEFKSVMRLPNGSYIVRARCAGEDRMDDKELILQLVDDKLEVVNIRDIVYYVCDPRLHPLAFVNIEDGGKRVMVQVRDRDGHYFPVTRASAWTLNFAGGAFRYPSAGNGPRYSMTYGGVNYGCEPRPSSQQPPRPGRPAGPPGGTPRRETMKTAMKKMLMAGVAALSIASASTAARADAALPPSMLGVWCNDLDYHAGGESRFYRGKCVGDALIIVSPDNYKSVTETCKRLSINRRNDKYILRVRCRDIDANDPADVTVTMWVSGNKLYIASPGADIPANRSASTTARGDSLPTAMVGNWCGVNDPGDDDSVPAVYSRRDPARVCSNGLNVAINNYDTLINEPYDINGTPCRIRRVKRVRGDAYSVDARCNETSREAWEERNVWRVVNERLVIADKRVMLAPDLRAKIRDAVRREVHD